MQGFLTATDHAIAAAGAVSGILEFDPDLSFMPFFFGMYLLQGSFLLLLFADKLQGDVSPDVVKACETVIRVHEACVGTLDTQYQVMYLRGRTPRTVMLTMLHIEELPEGDAVRPCSSSRTDVRGRHRTTALAS